MIGASAARSKGRKVDWRHRGCSNPRMPIIHAKRSEQFGPLDILGSGNRTSRSDKCIAQARQEVWAASYVGKETSSVAHRRSLEGKPVKAARCALQTDEPNGQPFRMNGAKRLASAASSKLSGSWGVERFDGELATDVVSAISSIRAFTFNRA